MIYEASHPSHGTMEGALITQTIIGILLLALLWVSVSSVAATISTPERNGNEGKVNGISNLARFPRPIPFPRALLFQKMRPVL